MNAKATNETPIIRMSTRNSFLLVGLDIATFMRATFASLWILLSNLEGSLCFLHSSFMNSTASQLQSDKHSVLHSSSVGNSQYQSRKVSIFPCGIRHCFHGICHASIYATFGSEIPFTTYRLFALVNKCKSKKITAITIWIFCYTKSI